MATLYSPKLESLYKEWQDADRAETNFTEKPHAVIVTRWVGRTVKTDQYISATIETAEKCYKYFMARGGIVTIMLVHIVKEYGLVEEPFPVSWT